MFLTKWLIDFAIVKLSSSPNTEWASVDCNTKSFFRSLTSENTINAGEHAVKTDTIWREADAWVTSHVTFHSPILEKPEGG